MENLQSHFHNWGGVLFFILLYGSVLCIPLYKKMEHQPKGTYIAFVIAFAFEMHGIPFSMNVIAWLIGKELPEGILWGHTLSQSLGHLGMNISIILSVIAVAMILNGWYHIYHNYWSDRLADKKLVTTGIYRLIRHPQYTGLLLLSLGMLLNWATLPTLLMFPVMIWMYDRLARKEEQDMIREFGKQYQDYRRKTKRFIPFVY